MHYFMIKFEIKPKKIKYLINYFKFVKKIISNLE